MWSRLLALPALVLGLLLAWPDAVAAQGTDPVAVVSALMAALNAGDADAATAQFAPNAVLTFRPDQPGTSGAQRGAARIRAQWRRDVGQHVHVVMVGTPTVNGTHATGANTVTSDDFHSLGITAPLL